MVRVVVRVMVGVMVGVEVMVGLEETVWSRLMQCDKWPMRPCLTECDLPDSR